MAEYLVFLFFDAGLVVIHTTAPRGTEA